MIEQFIAENWINIIGIVGPLIVLIWISIAEDNDDG